MHSLPLLNFVLSGVQARTGKFRPSRRRKARNHSKAVLLLQGQVQELVAVGVVDVAEVGLELTVMKLRYLFPLKRASCTFDDICVTVCYNQVEGRAVLLKDQDGRAAIGSKEIMDSLTGTEEECREEERVQEAAGWQDPQDEARPRMGQTGSRICQACSVNFTQILENNSVNDLFLPT